MRQKIPFFCFGAAVGRVEQISLTPLMITADHNTFLAMLVFSGMLKASGRTVGVIAINAFCPQEE